VLEKIVAEKPLLKMGITLQSFSLCGNWPVLRLRLKICDRGRAISGPINLIIFVDTP
jgi:hypothetical protein